MRPDRNTVIAALAIVGFCYGWLLLISIILGG